ncbi:Zn-ribbon domain-containing OB-fold protein [Nocardia abscessus]|jgi:uncharacterized protein|uniref:Zn-ribbon domain-containing OB-fold protein n=1 Tax=Nocardia TaxID=1817 RepID=UPI0018930794|nr:Zn-ribbon domain-containing OB-fold protein [Nocardia abscessus]MBF6207399.1 Zn-ribbon domain-containing OB-fold protein [Streptomyces gardneri]MBF6472436.1 Zn-ribbon domain-containing OB-fold protein [Nocardia abscessus]
MTTLSTVRPGETVRITTDSATEPFWQAAKQRRLVVARCGRCGHHRMPPTPFCPECSSTETEWPELSGAGEVYSYAVIHGFPGHPDLVLVAAVVDLADAPGTRLVTNIVGVDPETVEIGMPVRVDFTPIADGWLLPVFRAAEGDAGVIG